MKKLVLKLDLHDDKAKQKAMKKVSAIQGIDSIAMDMKKQELTIVGTADPVVVVKKLRKVWHTDVLIVEEAKKDEEEEEKEEKELENWIRAYNAHYNPQMGQYYYVTGAEERPYACVIS